MPLRAQEIASRLNLSRTPVREALSRLEQEGFVMREGDWGYIVRPVSHKDILDLFRIRESLEVQAALEAVPNIDRTVLDALSEMLKRGTALLKQKRYTDFRLLSREFHLAIAAASKNELLYRLLVTTRDRILLVGALHQNMRHDRAREVLLENAKILKALRSGNPKEVKASVLAHIRASQESILPSVAGIDVLAKVPSAQRRRAQSRTY